MLVSKKGFEIGPHFVVRRLQVPASAVISESPCQENQVVGGCCNLLGGVWESYGVGKVDGSFDLVDDRFKWLIDIVHGGHAGVVLLQGRRGDILVIALNMSNKLDET